MFLLHSRVDGFSNERRKGGRGGREKAKERGWQALKKPETQKQAELVAARQRECVCVRRRRQSNAHLLSLPGA